MLSPPGGVTSWGSHVYMVTCLLLRHNIQHPRLTRGEVCFDLCFSQQDVQQNRMEEGPGREKGTHCMVLGG